MNTAMRLLARMGAYRNEEQGAEASGGGGGMASNFQPNVVEQGVGIFDQSRADEAQQDDDEDVDDDPTQGGTPPAETGEGGDEQDGDGEDSGDTPPDEEPEAPYEYQTTVTYNGMEAEINIPDSVKTAFKEKNIDLNNVTNEFYSEEGLSQETRKMLNEAFGEAAVDMYIVGLEAKNEAFQQQQQAFVKAQQDLAVEASGGKFDEVVQWAADNLKPDEYQEYADLINGKNLRAAGMAIRELTQRSGLAQQATPPPRDNPRQVAIKGGENIQEQSGGISAAQYQEAISSGEYWKDTKGWDAKRSLGIKSGI